MWALREGTPRQRFVLAKEILERGSVKIDKVGANGLVTGTAIGAITKMKSHSPSHAKWRHPA